MTGTRPVFACRSTLSFPERHSLDTLNRYFEKHRPGLCADNCEINLPHALHTLAAPVNFMNEADAYQLAIAIDVLFRATADVMATDEGYTVVVHDELGDLNGWASERIVAVTDVVSNFILTPKRKERYEIDAGWESGYSTTSWQLSASERYTQQQRIERKLDQLLAMMTPGQKAGTPARAVDVFAEPSAKTGALSIHSGKPKTTTRRKATSANAGV